MILAPLAAAALLVGVAITPDAKPSLSPTMSMQQKSAAVKPLMRSATECIARIVSSDPRFGQPNADLSDLIVDSMPSCAVQVRIMIEAYDRYFGEGEGEAFFMGPYLDLLPGAVSKWVRGRNPHDWKEQQRGLKAQRQQDSDPYRGEPLGKPHRRNRADARADEGTHELARGATGENERQRQPNEGHACAFGCEHERQEQQESHAQWHV